MLPGRRETGYATLRGRGNPAFTTCMTFLSRALTSGRRAAPMRSEERVLLGSLLADDAWQSDIVIGKAGVHGPKTCRTRGRSVQSIPVRKERFMKPVTLWLGVSAGKDHSLEYSHFEDGPCEIKTFDISPRLDSLVSAPKDGLHPYKG